MLPNPLSPSTTIPLYLSRLRAPFANADPRTVTSFFLFGLLNNILYVLLLTAAVDLVGASVPKSLVLLADVVPSFIAKLTLPYVIQRVPYHVRIWLLIGLSVWGMLLVAGVSGTPTSPSVAPVVAPSPSGLQPRGDDGGTATAVAVAAGVGGGTAETSGEGNIPPHTLSAKMTGIILASLSSGIGEMTFLSLTHFYGPFALAAWGSGTGAAGLVGAGMYAFATGPMGWTSRTTILVAAVLPFGFLIAFFGVLDRGVLHKKQRRQQQRGSVDGDGGSRSSRRGEEGEEAREEEEGLLAQKTATTRTTARSARGSWVKRFASKLRRSRSLFLPLYVQSPLVKFNLLSIHPSFQPTIPSPKLTMNEQTSMLPLFLVYISEYTINTSLYPLLLFPSPSTSSSSSSRLSSGQFSNSFHHYHRPSSSIPLSQPKLNPRSLSHPITHLRSFYPTYSTLYQLGVFISRSSLPFYRLKHLYSGSVLQVLNLLFLLSEAVGRGWMPGAVGTWVVFGVAVWEGLLGGAVYVGTFARVGEEGRGQGGKRIGRGDGREEQGEDGRRRGGGGGEDDEIEAGRGEEERRGLIGGEERRRGRGEDRRDRNDDDDDDGTEFALAAVSVSDSAGIMLAGVLGLWLEPALCAWQVSSGRDACRRVEVNEFG